MSEETAETNGTDLVARDESEVVARDHSAPMSMTEFASWIEKNIGGSVADALSQAAFMLCCDVISQDIGKATLRLRERTSPTTSKIVMPEEHHVAALLATEPNRRHTWTEYTEMSVYWLCLEQNSYSVVVRNRRGDVLEIIPVQPGKVRELVEGREVFYEVTASTMQEQALLGATLLNVPERDMIHVRGRMLDGMDGYSTMTAGKKTLAVGKAIDEFRDKLFGEEGQVRGVFLRKDADSVMPELAFQRLRQQMRELMNRFRQLTDPVVLEGGVDFKPISSSPKDMELTQQFTAQINATCRLLRVPPHKVFSMEGVKYENLETSEKMYRGDTLVPICRRKESRLGRVMLTSKERLRYFFEYDRDEMTLQDPARETERVIKALERGAIEFDEARAKLGYNALPNGQGRARMIPVNMNVVDRDGNVLVGGTATPEEPEEPEEPAETPEPAEGSSKGLRLVQ